MGCLYNSWKRILTIVGDIYWALEPPKCKSDQIEALMEVIEIGQIICRGYNAYLDKFFIPGDYTHSGVVINKREVIHSVAEGVCSIHPIDFVKDCDRFILLQPAYSPILEVYQKQLTNVVDRAIWHCEANETEYDFTFQDEDKFYCHEFTVDCIEKAGIKVRKTRKNFGVWPFKFSREFYLASNLIEVCKIVYKFNPKEGR